jgi:hypothetical protein
MRVFIKNNAFSKLKKAMRQGDLDEMVNSMFHLKFNSKKAKTHGENILRETKRALRHLKFLGQPKMPAKVEKALEICQAKVGELWNMTREEIEGKKAPIKADETTTTPTAPTT